MAVTNLNHLTGTTTTERGVDVRQRPEQTTNPILPFAKRLWIRFAEGVPVSRHPSDLRLSRRGDRI